jgi:hypothetical protein
METVTSLLPYILTALGGQLVHILFKLGKLEKRKNFSLSMWLSKNTFTTLAGFVSALLGVWLMQESLINGDPSLAHGLALTAGYSIDSAIKNAKKAKESINN